MRKAISGMEGGQKPINLPFFFKWGHHMIEWEIRRSLVRLKWLLYFSGHSYSLLPWSLSNLWFLMMICVTLEKDKKEKPSSGHSCSLSSWGSARYFGRNKGEQRLACVSIVFPVDQEENYRRGRRILTHLFVFVTGTDWHQKSQRVEKSLKRARCIRIAFMATDGHLEIRELLCST